MHKINAKIEKECGKRYKVPLLGSSPKLARGLWSGIVSQGSPVSHLCVVLLLQQLVYLCHLLLLQPPLYRILRVSVKRILDLTCADLQSSKAGVDVV